MLSQTCGAVATARSKPTVRTWGLSVGGSKIEPDWQSVRTLQLGLSSIGRAHIYNTREALTSPVPTAISDQALTGAPPTQSTEFGSAGRRARSRNSRRSGEAVTTPGAGVAEGEGFVAGAVVRHDACDGDAEAGVVGHGRFQEGDGAALLLVGQDLAEGRARGVVDATCTNSQPAPRLSPLLRSPVMRWPTRSKRLSFLMSMRISSSGCSRS